MTNTMMGSLREVQKLDERIREIGCALTVFDEKIAEVEEPALALESELSQLMGRLTQMRTDARSLERSAEDKRARADKMDQRLNRVSNLREEAAVEALQMLEQIHRSETAAEALEAAATSARAEVGPQREVLLGEREAYSVRMETFTTRREDILQHVGDAERKVYDSFHQSGRPVIVSALLDDGACGNCFGLIPLQLQNEIRRNERLIRCENCGVILTVEPEPVLEGDVLIPVELPKPGVEAVEASEDEAAEAEDSEDDGVDASLLVDTEPLKVQEAEKA
jgi:predicted  nucleic acid-binding Zn-ribbon protein